MRFHTASRSQAGGRAQNQDFIGTATQNDRLCAVVADGLGGHAGGAIASELAVEAVLSAYRERPAFSSAALRYYLETAHSRLLARQTHEPALVTMRTTMVLLLIQGEQALWGHVGDSRLYHFHNGALAFQTQDHSVPQLMVRAGYITPDQVRSHEARNQLLRALGHDEELQPTLFPSPRALHAGDAFLLCTDGFWELVYEAEMAEDLAGADTPDTWLDRMETRLLARASGSYDNHSALALFVE